MTTDLETLSFDVSPPGVLNAKTVQLDASPNIVLSLAAGGSVTITARALTTGGLLLVYGNNFAGPAQSEVVMVTS